MAALLAPFALACLCVDLPDPEIPRDERDAFLVATAAVMPSLRFVAWALPDPQPWRDKDEDELYARAVRVGGDDVVRLLQGDPMDEDED